MLEVELLKMLDFEPQTLDLRLEVGLLKTQKPRQVLCPNNM